MAAGHEAEAPADADHTKSTKATNRKATAESAHCDDLTRAAGLESKKDEEVILS